MDLTLIEFQDWTEVRYRTYFTVRKLILWITTL